MKEHIKRVLKNIPFVIYIKQHIWKSLNINGERGTTTLDLTKEFPIFRPNSAGKYKTRALLTIKTINQTIPVLNDLIKSFNDQKPSMLPVEEFCDSNEGITASASLKTLFDKYGSDKASSHKYHYLYGEILKNPKEILTILEIGLGTNDAKIVSNMGKTGKPGASLRAFRDFLINAEIYGADIDNKVLFQENRIKTFYVDQTDLNSFLKLEEKIPEKFDLIVDDGLHSPNANLISLRFALKKIKVGGWVVIEDIGLEVLPLWEVVSMLLPKNYQSKILKSADALMFCIQKLS